jgi:hypothetical protein
VVWGLFVRARRSAPAEASIPRSSPPPQHARLLLLMRQLFDVQRLVDIDEPGSVFTLLFIRRTAKTPTKMLYSSSQKSGSKALR